MNEPTFTDLIDLAAERLGGAVLLANDEFFAPKESLLRAAAAEWREHEYTDRGKWMDGWETRRRRTPGHDWCLVRLGLPGVVRGVVVDTAYFRGNFPEQCELSGAAVAGVPDPEALADDASVRWHALLPRSPLAGRHAQHVRGVVRGAAHTPEAQHLPRRRRGAAARARRGASRARVACRRARAGPGRDGARRLCRLVQRHVLRSSPEPDPARPLDAHGRRLGDAPPPRTRPRLEHRATRRARRRSSGSNSTPITSRATLPAAARSSGATRRVPVPKSLQQLGRVEAAARRGAAAAARAPRVGCARGRDRDARAPEHLP